MSKRDAKSKSNSDRHADTYFNTNTHCNTKANADTEASPKSAASPNAAVKRVISERVCGRSGSRAYVPRANVCECGWKPTNKSTTVEPC